MKNRLQAIILGGALLAGASVPALARDNVSFSLSFGAPVYAAAPVYVAPPPVYYAPPPVVYYRPAPAPVYYGAPAVGFAINSGYGWRGHPGHHHRHHRHR